MPIPLFPLHVVLFPGAALPLHVFELRYRRMMADVLGPEDSPNPDPAFGVACIREGYEVGDRAETHDVGCLGVVELVRRSPDGTMDLVVRGSSRFRIMGRPPDDPYPRADIGALDEPVGPRPEEARRLAVAALNRYLSVVARYTSAELPGLELPEEPVAASYSAAGLLGVDLGVRQTLLEATSASERLARVAAVARSEATLLETVGPPVPRPRIEGSSLN